MLLEELLLESIPTFASLIKKRIEIYGEDFLYLSQESLITFLYVYSLICKNSELVGKVFLDYPFVKQAGSRGKFDIYVDVDPGYYIEVKYIRPIPSGWNIPLPQHRGSLIDDMTRLAYKTPAGTNKYLLLVAIREFIIHILNKPGFPLLQKSWHGKIRDLIVTATEENRISRDNRVYLDHEVELRLLKHEMLYRLHIAFLHIVLWKVTIS